MAKVPFVYYLHENDHLDVVTRIINAVGDEYFVGMEHDEISDRINRAFYEVPVLCTFDTETFQVDIVEVVNA